jgi:single-strand DNA-binding protein
MARKETTPEPTTAESVAQEQTSTKSRGPSVNRVTLIGRCVADPELRFTGSGKAVTSLRVATNDRQDVQYHDLVCWNGLAEIAGQHLSKGRLVYIDGHLQTRTWQADDGSNRRAVEVIVEQLQMLDRKPATS